LKGKSTYQTAVIDGQSLKVRNGQTILEAATSAGIYIPTLCHLETLEPYGGCRMCVVEVKNMKGFPTACTTPLAPGMEVQTNTPALQKLRKEILEFTLSEHPYTCLVCKDKKTCTDYMHTTRKVSTITGCNFCTSNGDCELQELVDYLELDDMKFPIRYRSIPPVKDNPFYDLDYNLCILCGRCVRICNEERNSHVLAFVERGNSTIVGTAFGESQAAAGCEFCGACVDVCPTGSISEKMGKWRGIPDTSVKTTCLICPVACDMNVNVRNGKLVQIGPVPGKRINPPQLCLRGKFLPADINSHPSRITKPFIRKENKWIEVSWEKALDTIAGKLAQIEGRHTGVIASGQDTLEDNFLLQKFTREVLKSNNLDLHHSYPGREIPALIHRLRTTGKTAGLAEVEAADTLLLFGSDASISHPLLENRIRKAYGKGKQVISFTAIPNRSSTFSTHEILYGPGSEEAVLRLLIQALGKTKTLKDRTGLLEERSGISTSQLEAVVNLLDTSGHAVLIAGDDLLRQTHSGQVVRLLSMLQSDLSTPGSCGILFPGYEGNLYGNAMMGVHPGYLPGFRPVSGKTGGLGYREMIRNTGEEGIRALMIFGDLPSHPGLAGLEFLVQCNMFMTELSEHADVVLPLPHFLESEGHILSMDNKLKKVNRVVLQPGNVLPIRKMILALAKAMGAKGFTPKAAELSREVKTLVQLNEQKPGEGGQPDMKPSAVCSNGKELPGGKDYPVSLLFSHNQFHYRGESMSRLVPELVSISGEGTLGLSESVMEDLQVQAGEPVRIISEYGTLESTVRLMPLLQNQVACFIPNGSLPERVLDELNAGKKVMSVKIEKA
jgi:formate dehydrogenase (NADP+) alpha subunit